MDLAIEYFANPQQIRSNTPIAAWRVKKPWWASAFYDEDRQTVCFSSIDLGRGIVDSFSARQRLAEVREQLRLSKLSQAQRLKHLVMGTVIPSRTGLKHRGRGLPSMREACKRGSVSNLQILTKRARAAVASDIYEGLDEEFPGTLVYWEVPRIGTQNGAAR